MKEKNNLPNFLIVGAAKSGTSSLHNYLNQHPDIFMPSYTQNGMKVKEPRFLITKLVKERLHNGVWDFDSYCELFKNSDAYSLVGESTVLYLYYYDEAIKNIKKYLGSNVKIVIMLRNPIERAYSAYNFLKRKGIREQLSFEQALENEFLRMKNPNETPMIFYKKMGLYFDSVKAYLDNFKDVHIIFYDDFSANTEKSVSDTISFLGASTQPLIDTRKRYNVGGKNWRFNWIRSLFLEENAFKKVTKYILPKSFRKSVAKVLISIFTRRAIKMQESTRRSLINYYREDVSNLSELLGKDLKHWLK